MPAEVVTLFLCGDVLLGRGVDQILPHPGDPELRERYMTDARAYVELAERVNGPHQRLRGHRRPRAVPKRSPPAVPGHRGPGDR